MVNHSDETKDEIVQLMEKAMNLSEDEDKLEEEIKTWKEVLEHSNLNKDIKAIALRSLGLANLWRYKTFKNLSDLDQTIAYFIDCEKVLDSTDSEYCSDPEIYREVYDRLGEAYTYKYDQSNDFSDLDAAIDYMILALGNSDQQDQHHIELVLELMRLYITRYEEGPDENKSVDDLNETIKLGEEIIKMLPDDSLYFPFVMHRLSKSFLKRHDLLSEEDDLKKAILSLVQLTKTVSHEDSRWTYGTAMLKFLHKSYPDLFDRLKIQLIDTADVHSIDKIVDFLNLQKFKEALQAIEKNLEENPNNPFLLMCKVIYHTDIGEKITANRILEKLRKENSHDENIEDKIVNDIFNSAFNRYNEEISSDPGNAESYIKRGLSFFRFRRYTEAERDLSKAISIGTNKPYIYQFRAEIYHKNNEFDNAVKDLTKAIELDRDNDKLYQNRGNNYLLLGKLALANKDLTKAIRLNPENGDLFFLRGEVKDSRGEYEAAIKDFSKAIELNESDIECFYQRGLTYLNMEDYDKAIKDFSKVIEVDPEYFYALIFRGRAHSKLGENNLAIADFSSAIAIKPMVIEPRYLRGIIHFENGNKDDALEDFNAVLRSNPNHIDEHINSVLSLNPIHIYAHINAGVIYFEKGEFKKAIKGLNQAIELDSRNYEAFLNRGICYMKLEQNNKAERDLFKAKSIYDLDPRVHRALGQFQVNKGNTKRALESFNEAIRLDPDYFQSYIVRAILNNIIGNEEAAKDDIRVAAELSGEDEDQLRKKFLTNSKDEGN